MASPLPIWRLSDGRRGHDNQSLGLIEALQRRVAVHCTQVAVSGAIAGALDALAARGRRRPSLVIGAGHATHLALIAAARRYRARSVVLMNPSLPRRLFDLCIVPRHDAVRGGGNVLLSLGALNRMQAATAPRDAREALVLLGGPSRHHAWDDAAMLEQIRALAVAAPDLRWVAAGSPRTPVSMLAALARLPGWTVVRFEDTSPQWLPERLARAGVVWVSEDSVSMAYEAVSSGAPTGILEVPARGGHSRVQAATRALLDAGLAIGIAEWRAGAQPRTPQRPLQEADRCARVLLERWPGLA